MRVGAIDCGTNSIRLLIADVDDGSLTDVVRMMRVVRLGQGVDATGRLADESLQRTFAAAEEYGALLAEHGVARLRFVATSATRDAQNRQTFVDGIQARLGVEPEVISGDEEAALSFAGAASVLDADRAEPILVIDVGGGSTEFVLGTRVGVTAAASVDVGCVRLTERHLHDDPPTGAQIDAAVADVDAVIDKVAGRVSLESTATVIGVAGSVTTVTAHTLGLDSYDRDAIHAAELEIDRIAAAASDLLNMSRSGRAQLPYMHPGRVDVIGSGALIWERILRRLQVMTDGRVGTAIASEHDILDGIALSAAGQATNGDE